MLKRDRLSYWRRSRSPCCFTPSSRSEPPPYPGQDIVISYGNREWTGRHRESCPKLGAQTHFGRERARSQRDGTRNEAGGTFRRGDVASRPPVFEFLLSGIKCPGRPGTTKSTQNTRRHGPCVLHQHSPSTVFLPSTQRFLCKQILAFPNVEPGDLSRWDPHHASALK